MDFKKMDMASLMILRPLLITAIKETPLDDRAPLMAQLTELDLRIQELAHEAGVDCEESDCEDCCGKFHGHEFDPDEGGYCYCGAHGSL